MSKPSLYEQGIVARYAAGETMKAIAFDLGHSPRTIRRILIAQGVRLRSWITNKDKPS